MNTAEIPDRRDRAAPAIGLALALGGLLGGAIMAWPALQSRASAEPAPRDMEAPLARALETALLDREFNSLPLETRLQIAKDLVERLRTMGAEESALLAAFAAGVSGSAREQLEKNLTELMTDVMRRQAEEYADAPPQERAKAMEEALLELFRLRDELDPTASEDGPTPEERLERMKERSRRDAAEQAGKPYRQTGADDASRLFDRVGDGMMEGRPPAERARMIRFMRDSVRYLRGEDLATGRR